MIIDELSFHLCSSIADQRVGFNTFIVELTDTMTKVLFPLLLQFRFIISRTYTSSYM